MYQYMIYMLPSGNLKVKRMGVQIGGHDQVFPLDSPSPSLSIYILIYDMDQ